MTIHEAQQQLLIQLYDIYDSREAATIADWILENITGWRKIDRIINKQVPLSADALSSLQQYTGELLSHKPVQYILQEAWFAGMKLFVDERVLIPRPETEELVEWIVQEVRMLSSPIGILDIGTGSGCIPIALKKKLPDATIYGCDISRQALEVARKNAVDQKVHIEFFLSDILNYAAWDSLPPVDLIVSNPPYIPASDRASMAQNVLQYEPHQALFTTNDDPLQFYKAIAAFAQSRLPAKERIFAEIHESMGQAVKDFFASNGFEPVEIRKDMQGKDRMVQAILQHQKLL